jgi:3-deoxy-7-phosphoheptulonate synthase
MGHKIITKVPGSDELIAKIPLSTDGYNNVLRHRKEIKNIISGNDDRLIVVVGPCSAWPKEAVLEYAARLKELSHRVEDKLKLVMRVYIQKPRTVKGWMGAVNQPDPLLPPDIEQGIYYARDMMVRVVEMGLPIADEALFIHNAAGFVELLSWVAIGARSSEDAEHRIFASSMDCAVGIKNPTSGSIKIGINGVVAAHHPHVAVFDGYAIETTGNPYAHLVLRGGALGPNYAKEYIEEVISAAKESGVTHPAVIIDASHDNSIVDGKKNYQAQANVVREIMQNKAQYPEIYSIVKGFMLESFIKEGRQDALPGKEIDLGGLSITDACLGFEKTEELLLEVAANI